MSYHKFTTEIYNSMIVSKFSELRIRHRYPSLEHFTKKNLGSLVPLCPFTVILHPHPPSDYH